MTTKLKSEGLFKEAIRRTLDTSAKRLKLQERYAEYERAGLMNQDENGIENVGDFHRIRAELEEMWKEEERAIRKGKS